MATTVMPTASPILAPSLRPPLDAGVDVGVEVAATAEGRFRVVLSAALPCLLEVVVAEAAAVFGRERVGFDVVVDEEEDEDLDVEAGILTVVKGAPSSRVLILGSWWQGWSRSCWQQKESLLANVVMPLPRSTTWRTLSVFDILLPALYSTGAGRTHLLGKTADRRCCQRLDRCRSRVREAFPRIRSAAWYSGRSRRRFPNRSSTCRSRKTGRRQDCKGRRRAGLCHHHRSKSHR